jgi:hypothetical protein
MKKLQLILDQLESHIPDFEKTNPTVSNSTIGWQIDHSLLVINAVVAELKNSNPEKYKWKFNRMRLFIQIVNTIPRGKARVPKTVEPIKIATIKELQTKLELARKSIAEISILPAKSFFTHPFFGDLNLKSAIWFLKLHTKHHLKIVLDIRKTS